MSRRNNSSSSHSKSAPSARLSLLDLESRLVPSVTVLNDNDSGAGSLRQAILDTNANPGPDTIDFDATFFATPRTINLAGASGELLITDDLTITGPGAANLTINGGGATRIFDVNNEVTTINVTISAMSVMGGNGSTGGPTPDAGDGGGIRVNDENLTLDHMVISGNSATDFNDGGGISADSTANIVIRNSTISGNTADSDGGGIYFFDGGSLDLESSTVSGNSSGPDASAGGGGIYFFGYVASQGITINNSTISSNSAVNSGGGVVFNFLDTTVGAVVIQNSTITGNTALNSTPYDSYGGGGICLYFSGGTADISVQNSIVSGNTSANGRDDFSIWPYYSSLTVNNSAIGNPTGFTLSGTSGNNLPFGASLNLQPLADNGGPTQTIALGAGSAAIDAGPTTVPGVSFDQRGPGFVRVSGSHADIGAFEVQAATPPTVTDISVNAGAAQRSRVTRLDVTFSTQVTFAGPVGNAFTLVRNSGGSVGFTATANIVGGVTVVTLDNFTGGLTDFGSLADGRYTLTVIANQVSAGGVFMASNVTFNDTQGLFRYFGDINGDQTVNGFDLGFFRNAFGTQTGDSNYLSYLDLNGDGVINGFDLGQFRSRFGTMLP